METISPRAPDGRGKGVRNMQQAKADQGPMATEGDTAQTASEAYAERIEHQVKQFAGGVNHVLAPARAAWQTRYLRPKLIEVMGGASHVEVYVKEMIRAYKAFRASGERGVFRIASVGSGDCALECQIAKRLVMAKLENFCLSGLEISPPMVRAGMLRIAKEGLAGCMETVQCDANGDLPELRVSAVIAHHSLHHIVNLEGLFDWVLAHLLPGGVFLSFDTIGRNGHMLWPESRYFVDRLWPLLPDKLRFDGLYKKVLPQYVDHDCSTQGFEGIRAQDILPLLVERFDFDAFLGYGGITDPFLGRRFADNFRADDPIATGFIELIEHTNDGLLLAGSVRPTRMAAVMRVPSPGQTRCWRGLDPRRAVRDPAAALETALPTLLAAAVDPGVVADL
jgi:SAM-dependent methyltransferase